MYYSVKVLTNHKVNPFQRICVRQILPFLLSLPLELDLDFISCYSSLYLTPTACNFNHATSTLILVLTLRIFGNVTSWQQKKIQFEISHQQITIQKSIKELVVQF